MACARVHAFLDCVFWRRDRHIFRYACDKTQNQKVFLLYGYPDAHLVECPCGFFLADMGSMNYRFAVKNFDGELAVYLAQIGVSARQITRLRKQEGLIKLNGKTVFSNARVKDGDEITITVADTPTDFVAKSKRSVEVVFEDGHFCIINKPAGLAVISTRRYFGDSLQNALASKWGTDFSFHPVNRLDKDTSGLMIVAKNSFAHDKLNLLLQQNKIQKTYLAVVEGNLDGNAIIDLPILDIKGQIKREISPKGKRAVTEYKALKSNGKFTLLQINLLTGRTHQIRVHMSNCGFPLVGDNLYGSASPYIDRQALHSYRLSFIHPFTSEAVDAVAELPSDMKRLLEENLQ